jgi:hypothetical protein
MSWLGDALKFEEWRLNDLWRGVKDDPQRLFTGAMDPIGTGIYNGITGDNLEPLGNQLGAPTEDQYERAEGRGIDTGPGRTMNDIAQVIAAIYGGNALSGAAGGGGASGASSAGSGGDWTQYAKLAANAYGSMNQPQTAQSFGTPPTSYQPKQFQDTFKEGQDKQRRKNIAASLMRRAG